MPRYLLRASYSASAVAGLIKNPSNRRDAAEQVVKQIGGRLECFYFAFGEDDVYTIFEAPDNAAAAAVSLAVGGTGTLTGISTVVLMTAEEGMEAMRKAGSVRYDPPG